ncbi:MAG: 50S ribosomal protein L11 [Phycisphaerales bacterium]
MAKKVTKEFKVLAPAGTATPAPPLGPVLGAAGVNPGQFIQQFNERTRELGAGKVVGCVITVFSDRSFDFKITSSPASVLIKEAAGVDKGSGEPQKIIGSINQEQLRAIAEEKLSDLNAGSTEAAMQMIAGTARSMGIEVAEA